MKHDPRDDVVVEPPLLGEARGDRGVRHPEHVLFGALVVGQVRGGLRVREVEEQLPGVVQQPGAQRRARLILGLCAARGLRGEDLTLASAITFVSLSLTEVLTSLRDCTVGMLVLESLRASFRS